MVLAILSFVSPYDPRASDVVPIDLSPTLRYPLGTDSLGRDVFWSLTQAIKGSFYIGIITVVLSRLIATTIGLVAGYKGGITDRILMTVNDGFVVLPVLPIIIFLGFVLRDRLNVVSLSFILAMFGWAWDARLIRSVALSLRQREFTFVALFSGTGTFKLVFREYLPFVIPLILATSMTNMLWAIGMEITLAIFGLSNIEMPTLGVNIYWANQYQALFRGLWWWMFSPVVVAILLFVSLYMISNSINEFLDPRTKLEKIKMKVE
jgi:peptide/nickel transport system permease protein